MADDISNQSSPTQPGSSLSCKVRFESEINENEVKYQSYGLNNKETNEQDLPSATRTTGGIHDGGTGTGTDGGGLVENR